MTWIMTHCAEKTIFMLQTTAVNITVFPKKASKLLRCPF